MKYYLKLFNFAEYIKCFIRLLMYKDKEISYMSWLIIRKCSECSNSKMIITKRSYINKTIIVLIRAIKFTPFTVIRFVFILMPLLMSRD